MMSTLIWLAIAAMTVIPIMKLLPAQGVHPHLAVITVIELGLIVLLWMMAARV
ncbi:MAG: hypothetical protein ACPGNV_01880 [Mangrovicoccus sp.]